MFSKFDPKKIVLVLLLVFLGTAAASCFIYAVQYGFDFNEDVLISNDIKNGTKVDVEKTEDLQGLTSILAETISEDIKIIPVDSDNVKVHLYGYYLSSDPDLKPKFIVDRSGSTLNIKVEWSKNAFVMRFVNNLKLDVSIPRQYAADLKVRSTSGEIAAEGLTLDSFAGKTTSGEFDLKKINAKEATVETTSGETKLNGTYDSFKFQSTSGGLTATDFSSKSSTFGSTSGEIRVSGYPGDLKADTVSGGVDLQYDEFSNKTEVTTTSGEVGIKLPATAGFALDFSSTSGEVVCDFPITSTGSMNDHKLKGTVGNGEGSIFVRTTSGELKITK